MGIFELYVKLEHFEVCSKMDELLKRVLQQLSTDCNEDKNVSCGIAHVSQRTNSPK